MLIINIIHLLQIGEENKNDISSFSRTPPLAPLLLHSSKPLTFSSSSVLIHFAHLYGVSPH